MSTTQALATRDQRMAALAVQDVRSLIPNLDKCSEAEVKGFILYCQAVNADPWAKEIYLVKYSDKDPAAIVLALNWYLKRAANNPKYKGYKSGLIVERKGQYIEVEGATAYPGDHVFAGWCLPARQDAEFSPVVVELEKAIRRFPANHSLAGKAMGLWASDPNMMLEVTAIRRAVRRAFPEDFREEPDVGMPVVLEGEVVADSAIPQPMSLSQVLPCTIHKGEVWKVNQYHGMSHVLEGLKGPKGGRVFCEMEEVLARDAMQHAQEGPQAAPEGPSGAKDVAEENDAAPRPSFEGTTLAALWNYGMKLGFKGGKPECLAALKLKDDALIADLKGAAAELERLAPRGTRDLRSY